MIDKVVKNNLCTNCGTCISACPFDAVFYEKNENGYLMRINEDKCRKCGFCLSPLLGTGDSISLLGMVKAARNNFSDWFGHFWPFIGGSINLYSPYLGLFFDFPLA